ncbi:SARP family transcriptional regulator [Streptomyces cyaneogriseus subsp. noncyanogenus]|uniref:SARP family transcriptional regulator n=1 Tax=Streptomyces cyaneogriseus subsp. noncyanogenus TaxID=477245 RepID=A0A0C5FRQ6_9ACTN|nr:tetratricopeptide repeat protein [Streptomyces cyaneogriseus]AJP02727.1 SARP family transcriptional regulator [Streptomyces cyaneogriseus subsp. noncyanogenus]
MEFEIRLSGAVEIRAAGRRSDLGSTKTRVALAGLAWDAGRTVSVDTLVHRIWDEHPPGKAREALHAHISRIRGSLRLAGRDAPVIVSRTNSYSLQVDPNRVDLHCYRSCVERARTLRDGGDEGAALRLLDRAEGLWHGEPLAGITGSWAEHLRTAIGEIRLVAAMNRAEILLHEGKYADAVPVLMPLADAHPVDEALAERLAVALYGSNRTAEATRLLQRTRQRVVRDIGLDAGGGLHRVHQGILSGAPAAALLTGARSEGKTTARPSRQVPDNLPRDVPWAGRRDELRRLTAALCEDRGVSDVVTVEAIHGMGGVGKTALAVHLAHRLRDRFPDGRVFLHLGGCSVDRTPPTAARALTELLRLLGMSAKELPPGLDELVALWRSLARDRRMLVILDDATSSEQIRPLLPGASPTAIVVTSRRRLPGLPGVRPVSLDVLPPEDAAALFSQRLGRGRDTDPSDVTEIVRICGCLPLAIEIAASRLLTRASWTTTDLLRQLGGNGGHLAQLRDMERTLTHVFAVSYHALNADQQMVFRRIGLHVGVEFGPPAIAALTGFSLEVVERVLEDLLAHHLVAEPVPHRFTMHDLLRDYARSLVEAGDTDPEDDVQRAMQRLVDHYVSAADRADRLAYPFRSRTDLDACETATPPCPEIVEARSAEQWLIAESANLLDTLDWLVKYGTEHQLAVAVHVLAGFLDMEGHLAAAEPLLRRAAAHWGAAGDSVAQARALLDLCAVYTHGSRYGEAISAAREAVDIARHLRDRELESECIHQLSISLWQTGQYRIARSFLEDSLDYLLQTRTKLRIARCQNLLGIVHLHLAENEKALTCFSSALADFTEIGYDRGIYSALNNTAEVYKKTGRPEDAEKAYRQALVVAEKMGNPRDRATLQMNVASVMDALGRTEEALVLYGMALPVLRDVGDRRAEAIALTRIGRAYRMAGRTEEALRQHADALEVAHAIHAAGEEVDVLYDLALAERDAGRTAQAVAHLQESLAVSRRIGAPAEEARAAGLLADLQGEVTA